MAFREYSMFHIILGSSVKRASVSTLSIDWTSKILCGYIGDYPKATLLTTIVAVIYTDIAWEMRHAPDRAIDQYVAEIRRIQSSWDGFKDDILETRPTLPMEAVRHMKGFESRLVWASAATFFAETNSPEDNNKLRFMPVYLGRILTLLYTTFRVVGFNLMEYHQAIPAAAHLYMASLVNRELAPNRRNLGSGPTWTIWPNSGDRTIYTARAHPKRTQD